MHELSITQSILKIACEHAEKTNAQKVSKINLVIGQLSSMVDDCVQFYWDQISKETLCSQAQLHFTRVPAKLECQKCQHQYEMGDELTPCPDCGSIQIQFISGDEFFVESIEVVPLDEVQNG